MLEQYLKEVQRPRQKVNPLFNFLGVQIDMLSREKVILRLPLRKEFIQGGGVIAGGIVATLADEAMAHVVLANLEDDESTATIEMNARYLKPIVRGHMKAEARVVKKGRKLVTVAASVCDDKGDLLAQAGATFMVIGGQRREQSPPEERRT